MPPNLDQYIKLSAAPRTYQVSVKTLRRRLHRAREAGDDETLQNFLVRTRDGEVFEQPATEVVNGLTKDGKMPSWYVAHHWLLREFGAHPGIDLPDQQGTTTTTPNDHRYGTPTDQDDDQPKPKLTNVVDAMQQTIDTKQQMIDELRVRLDRSEQEKKDLLVYAQTDKELFAKANDSLTKLLAAGEPQTKQGDGHVVDTTPRTQPVEKRPKQTAAKTKRKTTKQSKKTPQRAGIARWLLGK